MSNARAEMIFREARGLPAADQAAYLDEICGADRALRAEVEALLAAGAATVDGTGATSHGALADRTVHAAARERPGEQIGRYKLLQAIGEGGFGSVWMAEQREPVKRRVALKIIKLGMDTKQVIARFEAERQALAMMDHPHIAKVFDAGSTDTGRPYFVMEYIKGVPILEYCDTERLDTSARLELFISVCNAIQHAHQKGIIHRDIKPSNVLITMHDGTAAPKVIDFGVAKATNTELTQKTLFTEHRQVIGTPAYMSPEQAEMSGLDIDTRSDIYSLGVLLYELLTGTTPFEPERLMQSGFAEMMRIIREDEPHKPSTRLSALGDAGTRTAEQRQSDPGRLFSTLRGDLDWIVMKCLEKDRTRRYDTANGLAEDIERHLSDEPVVAGPPSARYRLGKFVRRNRVGVTAAAVVGAAVIVGVVGTTAGMLWALEERDRADQSAADASVASRAEAQARALADTRAAEARTERERAERELVRATEAKLFITEMLGAVGPEVAQGRDTALMRAILDGAAARLAAGEVEDVLIEAELRATVGRTLAAIGEYGLAEPHLVAALDIRRRELGGEDPDTLASIVHLGGLRRFQGRLPEAVQLYREALEARRRVLGDDDPGTLASMNALAVALWDLRRLDEAEPYFRETLERRRRVLGGEHPDTLSSISNMGTLLFLQGRLTEAAPLFREALEIRRGTLGENHPSTLASISNMGELLFALGQLAEAEAHHREALAGNRRVYGDGHPGTLYACSTLGALLFAQGRLDDAEPYLREALTGRRRTLGDEHPTTLNSMNDMGALLVARGRHEDAEALLRESLETGARIHQGQWWVPEARSLLGAALAGLRRYDEAEPLLLDGYAGLEQVLPPGERGPRLRPAVERLVDFYEARHRLDPDAGYEVRAAEWRGRLDEFSPPRAPGNAW